MPYRHAARQIEPRLRDFLYLGDNRARVTYEWVVGEPLRPGLPNASSTPSIRRRSPGVRTTLCSSRITGCPSRPADGGPGDVIVDGPHELKIRRPVRRLRPDDWAVPRRAAAAAGAARRVRIASCSPGSSCSAKGGQIRGVTAEKPTAALSPGSAAEADFTAHMNPAGTWIDFGKVATDGWLKVDRQADRLVVFPYPCDRAFRATLDLRQLAPAADAGRVQVLVRRRPAINATWGRLSSL